MEETRLGPYELLEQLGAGGMATVYRAYQPSMERQVAVKVIRSALIHDAASRERFQREARLIARLEHPHIVPVYDFDGAHEPPYIVMRYIKGSTLKEVMRSSARLPYSDIIYLLQQVASALDYAHRQGVIHRDIKPSNIILDQDGNAFLSDFGIARFSGDVALTASGTLGTPAYMAPEQSTGVDEVGHRADLYSLGVVAFELLTGSLPFDAETQLAMAFKHLHDPPPHASQRNPALSAGVDAVLERSLAKRAADRFETAGEFVQALAQVLQVASGHAPTGLQTVIEVPNAAQQAPSHASSTVEQNKVVTVLHADAAEYMEIISEASGAEAAHSSMHAFWRQARQLVASHQGRIIFSGETDLSAIWGAEITREDDPERALSTALDLQTLLRRMGEGQFVESEEEPLPLRIGVNTGMALIVPNPQGWVQSSRPGAGDTPSVSVSGAALTLAQRLAENADGIILISHNTYREVAGAFSVRPAEPLRMRGRKEPVETYLVIAVKARSFRVRQHGIEGLETRMIGRDAQLKALQNAFLDAVEDRETQFITILGEAGLGKSRLAYEFIRWGDLRPEKYRIFRASVSPDMLEHPYALWRDILSFRFQILENDPADVLRQKMESGVAEILRQEDNEMAHLLGYLAGFDFDSSPFIKGLSAEPQQLVNRARQMVVRFFARLGEFQPMMMVLEDIHFADDASLDLLTDLVNRHPDLPLLILCLARPQLLDRRPGWCSGQPNYKRLLLEPLDRRDSRDLARELMQRLPELPKTLRDLLVDRAEGNPLYMEELVKMLLDDRVIVKASDTEWRVQLERLDEVRVPPSLVGLLQARLDSLLTPERLVLQRASVIGRIFYDTALAALDVVDEARDHVADPAGVLRQLIQREFIQKREISAFAGSAEYAFVQSMLRDQIYATLLHRQVVAYHNALADWLASGPRADEYLPRIAECYEKGGKTFEAANFLLRAGRQVLHRGAPREALRFLERALSLLPVDGGRADQAAPGFPAGAHISERVEILLSLGEAKRMLGDFAAAQADLKSALILAWQPNENRQAAAILYQLSRVSDLMGDYTAVRNYLDQALPLARQLSEAGEDRLILARALHGLANLEWRAGNLEKAILPAEECLTLARTLEDHGLELNALNTYGSIIYDFGRLDESRTIFEKARLLGEQTGNLDLLVSTLNNLGELERVEGNFHEAIRWYEEALALTREIGNQYNETLLSFNLGMVALAGQRDIPQARRNFLDALRQAVAMRAQTLALAAIIGLAGVRALSGDPNTALTWVGLALNHPAADADLHHDSDIVVEILCLYLAPEAVDAGLSRTQTLKFDQLVQQLLDEGDPSAG